MMPLPEENGTGSTPADARLDDLKTAPVPPVPPLWAAVGPGIVWMALAQGSAELYYWPHFAAKYGALYLFLLVPACLLQTPLNIEIGRYTLLTGESAFRGFVRLHRGFGALLWLAFAVNFIFLGGWATMGATALADIVAWPSGWDDRARTLLWAYAITAVFACALVVGRTAYRMIERFMMVVALVTAVGLVIAALQPEVRAVLPGFLAALVVPPSRPSLPADPHELEQFLTMICYSGLGGFWSLFYSLWIREKGYGMSAYVGHITSPITGRKELIAFEGYRFEDTPENRTRFRDWMRTMLTDNAVGLLGNLGTTLLMALLAFAVLHPRGIVPEGWRVAAEQSAFFAVAWGPAGRVVFLVIAGCFLMDTWLAGVDAVSRVHAEMTCTYAPGTRSRGLRFWYYVYVGVAVALTWITIPIGEPTDVVTFTGVLSLFAVAVFATALWILNHRVLPRAFPAWTRPGRLQSILFAAVILFYAMMSVYYLLIKLRIA
jgi:Mn2+/Fe2+ NRAMP family transporter